MQNRKCTEDKDLTLDQYVELKNAHTELEGKMDDLNSDLFMAMITGDKAALEQVQIEGELLKTTDKMIHHNFDDHCVTAKATLKTARDNAVSVLKNGIFTAEGKRRALESAARLENNSDTEEVSSCESSPVTPRM